MAHLRINSYTAGSLKKEIAPYWVGGEEKKTTLKASIFKQVVRSRLFQLTY